MRSTYLRRLSLVLAALALAPLLVAAAAAEILDSPESPWESAVTQRPQRGSCEAIDPVFVVPVRPAARGGAVGLLNRASAIPIDLPEVARLGSGVPQAAESQRYDRRLRREIDELQARRRRALEERGGNWSLRDEQRLRNLVDLYHDDTAPLLSPFLVRAVAMRTAGGGFSARLCAGDLWIDHESLAADVSPALRHAVIVYLAQRPRSVYATRSLAR